MGIPGFGEGGVIPDDPDAEARIADPEMSPSGGAIEDDIHAEIRQRQPAQLNAGEFVMPKDVVQWLGEKGMQQFILKARKEMAGPTASASPAGDGASRSRCPSPSHRVALVPSLSWRA